MKRTLLARDGFDAADRVRVANNFALESFAPPRLAATGGSADAGRADDVESRNRPPCVPLDPRRNAPVRSRLNGTAPFRLLFAGNLGRFQNLPRLVDAARRLGEGYEIVFMGAGLMREELRSLAADVPNVTFLDQAPVEAAVEQMRQSDLGVVSLSPGVCRVAYPSKSMTYLSAGLPLLALVEDDSDLADEVRKHDFGYAAGQVDGEALAAAVRAAAADRHRWDAAARAELADRAGRVFGSARALAAWDEVAGEWAGEFNSTGFPCVTTRSRRAA